MSLYQDRQIKGFLLFLTLFALLFVGTATVLTIYQVNDAEVLWLKHDEAVSSSLLEQGVPKEVVAVAFTNTDISDDGRSLLAAAGLGKQSESSMRPYFNQFQRSAFCTMLCTVLFFLFVLAIGIFIFFWKRKRLYQQADKILLNYINGDYSCHLPQNYEGAIYQVFSSIEQLATMLQSKNETERKAKEFLKDTISDISHQLKTPLAALTMYQEIIESEPENAETVKQFAAKMGISLKRMEQLILSMLKITRLDTGNIIFEKKSCRVSELIAHSVNDLTTRAKSESKQIQIDGDGEQQLICDMEWTGEAIGNIVKNALDHTQAGGIVRITWERTPAMFRIFISDNGNGIVPEDIYHNHTFQIVCFQFKKFSAQLLHIIGVNRLIFIAAFCNLVYAACDTTDISRLLFKHLKIVMTHFALNQLFPAISGEVCHPGFLHFSLNNLKLFFRKKEQFADRSFSVLFHLSGPFLVKRAWGIFPKRVSGCP